MLASGRPLVVERLDVGGDRHQAEQREQAEHEAVGRQRRHVAADGVAALARQQAGHTVRVEKQRERGTEGQRRVPEDLRVGEQEAVGDRRLGARELLLGCAEDVVEAAELDRDVDDGRDHDDVDQRVLDERDQRRRAQARLVRVGGEDHEGDDQRPLALDAHHLQHRADAHELQRDVGHRRDDAGDRDHQRERRRAVAAADEVGRRHVAVLVRHRPQPRRDDERHREDQDRVRDGEEADRADGEHEAGDGHERVRGVEVAAEQEPGDPAPELAPAEAPLVEVLERLRLAPARRPEAHPRDEREQGDEDDQLDPLDVHVSAPASSSRGRRGSSGPR